MATNGTDDDLEDLLGGREEASRPRQSSSSNTGGPNLCSNVVNLVQAWVRYLCYAYPFVCTCVTIGAVLLAMIMLFNAVLNPTENFGVIQNQDYYTNINSQYDLTLGKVDHWCLQGGDESCRCEDPLVPSARAEFKSWTTAYQGNKALVNSYRDSDLLDVAFLGESLVEEMDGRWMGKTHTDQLKQIQKSFRKNFKKDKSGVEGVALGIAGDTAPNVLWRIRHGEMPTDFNPTIWWINLGMNDLGRMQCSEEVVVMGILRVVEEIRTRKPDAHVVINSMLPMADLRGGIYPLVKDYRDAFRPIKGHGGNRNNIPASHFARGVDMDKPPKSPRPVPQDRPQDKPPKSPRPAHSSSSSDEEEKAKAKKPAKHESSESSESAEEKETSGRRFLKKKKDAEDHSSDEEEPNNPDKKKRKRNRKRLPNQPYHPKLDAGKVKIKKFDAKKGFLEKTKLPLWVSITSINRVLRKFCDKQDKITFFDATPIFAERIDRRKFTLLNERISMRGHPTVEGYEMWEKAILKKVQYLLEKDRQEKAAALAALEAAARARDYGDDYNTMDPLMDDDYARIDDEA